MPKRVSSQPMNTSPRRAVLGVLDSEFGGKLENSSGRCTAILAEATGQTTAGLNGLLHAMRNDLQIKRVVRGRLTFSVEVIYHGPRVREMIAQWRRENGKEEPEVVKPVIDLTEKPQQPVGEINERRLALELLDEVVRRATEPSGSEEVIAYQQRIQELEIQVKAKTEQLDLAHDRVAALGHEVRGLRDRLRTTESNLQQVIEASKTAALEAANEERHKALDSFMRQRPSARR